MWKRCLSLWLAITASMSAASDSTALDPAPVITAHVIERSALIPTEARRAAELDTAFPDDVIVRVGDGENPAVGVYRDAIDGTALGVVVVVLGAESSHDAHVDSTSLRRSLPRGQWATLTVVLPDVPNESLPPRQHDKLIGGATVIPTDPVWANSVGVLRSDSADPMPARVRERLDAAVKAARAKGSSVVVLGEGIAGAWVAWAQSQGLGADAVVAINIKRDAPRIDGKRPKDTLAVLTAPALLLIESPLDWSVEDRLAPAIELRLLPPGNPSATRLDRRIRGWLKRRFGARA